jgi:hypothetical protein
MTTPTMMELHPLKQKDDCYQNIVTDSAEEHDSSQKTKSNPKKSNKVKKETSNTHHEATFAPREQHKRNSAPNIAATRSSPVKSLTRDRETNENETRQIKEGGLYTGSHCSSSTESEVASEMDRRKEILEKYVVDVQKRAIHHNHRAVWMKRGIRLMDSAAIVFQAGALSSLAATMNEEGSSGEYVVLVLQSLSFIIGMLKLGSQIDVAASVHAINAKQYADLAKINDMYDMKSLNGEQVHQELDRITRSLMIIGDNETYRLVP